MVAGTFAAQLIVRSAAGAQGFNPRLMVYSRSQPFVASASAVIPRLLFAERYLARPVRLIASYPAPGGGACEEWHAKRASLKSHVPARYLLAPMFITATSAIRTADISFA
jgi:hypothetical protein